MAELEVSLLSGALRFAHARAAALLTSMTDSSSGLLQPILGQPSTAEQLIQLVPVTAQAQAYLDTANTALTALQTALSPPPTALSDLSTSTQPLATLLQQTAAAAGS